MYSMPHCYIARITTSICRETREQESPASRAGPGVIVPVGHHLMDRLVSTSRVPIRGTLPNASDQVILGRDMGAIGRASLISRASRANTDSRDSSKASIMLIRANRASGEEVTAIRAVVSRDRGEATSRADVLGVVDTAIGVRIFRREIGPHSSRVPIIRHKGHFFQLPSQHQRRHHPYQPSQQL